MKTNESNFCEVFLKLFFLFVRLGLTLVSNGIDTFMLYFKSFIEFVDRFGDEKIGDQLIEHINQCLSLTSQLKNLWLSDIVLWKPITYNVRNANNNSGKVAVVTGADRDVGQYTALILAKLGFKVNNFLLIYKLIEIIIKLALLFKIIK